MAGSRWSKKLLVPVSSVSMELISSGVRLEVEDVQVLGHALFANGFRDRYDAALRQPAHDHLRDALAMVLSDRTEQGIVEDVVPPLGERSPRLDLDAVLLQELLRLDLLMERMRLDLIHG